MNNGFRSKFFQNYAAKVLPKIGDMEKYRQSKYKLLIILETLIIIAGLYFLSIVLANFFPHTFGDRPFIQRADWEIWLAFFAPIILVALMAIAYAIPPFMDKNYKTKVKEACMFDLLQIFGDIRWFDKYLPVSLENNITLSELYEFVNCKFEDAFIGVYNNVNYTVAETILTTYVHTKNGKREVQLFKGIILDFPFNKDVKAHTIIEPKATAVVVGNAIVIVCVIVFLALFIFIPGLWSSLWAEKGGDIVVGLIGALVSAIAAIVGSRKFKKIKLEDVVFDKDYAVKSEDQVEARYLITPSFMERFKNLGKAYKSKQIKCALYGNHLIFAISTPKDLFEVGSLYHPLSDSRQVETFYNEISAIFDIIDEFKLNEKTGL